MNNQVDSFLSNSVSSKLNLQYIPPEEFITSNLVGRGTFGYVKQATWLGQKVAIKFMFTKTDFTKEAEQLSRVKHENIIGVFGYTNIEKNDFGLILEFAEDGNFHNFLHDKNMHSVDYTLSHAISWCLQCARAVHYLHSLDILHRDLKPSNLLLTNKCRTIKICDFGTAREKHTTMSINQGTACWMAPEVFRSKKYSEKCDVFSWGIILWEVLTRQAPYQNMESNFSTLWAIHKGMRPPMIRDCPEIFRRLITSCWDHEPSKRPSMEKVVKIMEKIFSLCSNEAREEINLIRLSQENFEYVRISNISNHNTANNKNNNAICSDDCLSPRIPKQNLGHKRSNSSDASIILSQDNNENTEVPEEKIQEILRNFNAYLFLPSQFSPPSPDIKDTQSMMVFEDHRKLSLKLFRMKFECEFLLNRIKELNEKKNKLCLVEDSSAHYIHLTNEKINLQKTRSSFAKQLMELLKNDSVTQQRTDNEWVLVDTSSLRQ